MLVFVPPLPPHYFFFFLSRFSPPQALHSFPTRRSSDLDAARARRRRAPGPPGRRPAVPRPRDGAAAAHRRRAGAQPRGQADRKSTRLNSSHLVISYAVFCLKKKKVG